MMVNIVSYSIGLTITIINKLIINLITIIVNYEGLITYTEINISLARKLTLAMFVNTAIQSFVIKVVIPWSLVGFDFARSSIINPGGLTWNQNSILLSNLFFTFIWNLTDPFYLFKMAQKEYAKK